MPGKVNMFLRKTVMWDAFRLV